MGVFPFTYLGPPLSDHRLRNEDFILIFQTIERRLAGVSTLLDYDGRLQLIKSVLSALPIFFMCALALPAGIVEQINKYIRNFL